MTRWLRFLPLLVLVAFIGAVAWRLNRPADEQIPSQLIGKPVPVFTLAAALPGKPGLSSGDLTKGQPRMVNVFASWCVPCIAEAPVLAELKRHGVRIDGIAIRDRPGDLAAFLAEHGDPFERIGADDASRVQLALGSAGVPESFVVDGRGTITYQHVGPIMPEDIPTILAEMAKAR